MVIGKINRGSKERLMVTVEDFKGSQVVNLGIYKIINDGELSPTGENISFTPDKIEMIINLLREAQKKTV
ncbi:MAG: hypothetical protein LBQ00_01715 [Syntrophobacterales bacterium]|jgi:hypothetical protein|nr:hypothetical protein [Syntrophobacterales bacterium]